MLGFGARAEREKGGVHGDRSAARVGWTGLGWRVLLLWVCMARIYVELEGEGVRLRVGERREWEGTWEEMGAVWGREREERS